MPNDQSPPTQDVDPRIARTHERYFSDFPAFILAAGQEYPCQITNVSPNGALIEYDDSDTPFHDHKNIVLRVPNVGKCVATLLWLTPQRAGLAFDLTDHQKATLDRFLIDTLSEDL